MIAAAASVVMTDSSTMFFLRSNGLTSAKWET